MLLFVSAIILDEYQMAAALRSGRYTAVEGIVTDFHLGDEGDHLEESWMVESRGRMYRYRYVRSKITPGYRTTQLHGGPIHAGLHVRVADVDGHIARLEIAE